MNSIVTQHFIKCHNKLKEEGKIRSSRQFAIDLDYLPQSLSEILKMRRDVTIELLRKCVTKFKVSPTYLFTGEGPMFLSDEDMNKSFRVLTVVTDPSNDERIVHVPVQAQAGYPSELAEPSFISDLPTFTLPDYKYKNGTFRSFDVAGDSMEPTLFEGDKVICSFMEPSYWESSLKDNFVYVIVTQGDVLVKRIENMIKDKKQLLLISDNAYYEPYTVNLHEIKEVWYVRARLSPFLPSPGSVKNILQDEVVKLRNSLSEQSRIIESLYKTIEELVKKS
jgi:phage repressor protein C with HTH and peptisase S24 domain